MQKIIRALNMGADVNAVSTSDEWGLSPLHVAVKNRCYKVVDYLLTRSDTDINIIDDFERTPLHLAAEMRNKKIFWLLIRAGANPNFVDINNLTPVDIVENIRPINEPTSHVSLRHSKQELKYGLGS